MSGSYTRHGRERMTGPGLIMILVLSATVTIVLIVTVLAYYSGSSARIAGDYTAVAGPADTALAAEENGYTRNQRNDLAAARSDLAREAKTEDSFDSQLAEVTFPAAANAIAEVLIQADKKRAKLIGLQAQSTSLGELRSFDSGDQTDAAAVQLQVGRIRQALGLAPASQGLF